MGATQAVSKIIIMITSLTAAPAAEESFVGGSTGECTSSGAPATSGGRDGRSGNPSAEE